MAEYEFSRHARAMLDERQIIEEWVWRTINTPDGRRMGDDANIHFTRAIRERNGQILHVVVNPYTQPNKIVTVYFDRRLSKSGTRK